MPPPTDAGGPPSPVPEFLERLTDHRWRSPAALPEDGSGSRSTWDFFPSGTFRHRILSDYVQTYAGAWSSSLEPVDGGWRGILFLAGTVDRRFARFDVLSFQLGDDGLRLGEGLFREDARAREAPPPLREEERRAVSPDGRGRTFSLWHRLADDMWRSEEPDPPAGEPTGLGLRRDGTYVALFAADCQYSGTWSLVAASPLRGEIRLSVPPNPCDAHGARRPFVRQAPISLGGAALLVGGTNYLSAPR